MTMKVKFYYSFCTIYRITMCININIFCFIALILYSSSLALLGSRLFWLLRQPLGSKPMAACPMGLV